MKIHPYANLFPMCSDEEVQQLADDIATHGLRQPIVTDVDEMILDGRNRAAACLIAGVKPIYEPFVGTDAEKLAYVVSVNVHRRHLTTKQRADIAAQIATMSVGANQHSRMTTKEGPSNDGGSTKVSTKTAAKLMNVSTSSVERAKAASKPPKKGTTATGDTPATPSSTASIVQDRLGKPVPEHLRESHQLSITLLSIGRELDKYRQRAKELAEKPGGECFHMQNIDDGVRGLKAQFQDAGYYTVCPRCDGAATGCKKCDEHGWIPEWRKNQI